MPVRLELIFISRLRFGFVGFRRRSASAVSVAVATSSPSAATGTGAASKATTISNLAMKLRVRHSLPPPSDCSAVPAPPPSLLGEFGGLDADPGDAVDVLERGDEAGDRLLARRRNRSVPGRGRRTDAAQAAPPPPSPPAELPGEAVALRLSSQTSSGRTSESSRITRSQSKRLSARLATVATRCSLQGRELNVRRRGAAASRCGRRVFALQLGDFGLAFGDLVAGEHQQRSTPSEDRDEGADERRRQAGRCAAGPARRGAPRAGSG